MSGQCNSCDYTIGATGDPTPAIPNNATNISVCITANRTIPINFNNAQQVTVCINEGVTVTSAFNNLSNLLELNNYGDFIANNYNGNWTINNFGTMSLNFNNLNNNKTINNFGTLNRTGAFVINGTLNSSGTLVTTGNLSINGGGTYISSGITTVGGNLTNNGLIDAPAGNFSVNGILTNNGSGILNIGQGTVSGNVTNNGIINIFDRIEIDGNVTLNGGGRFVAANVENPSYVIVEGSFSGSDPLGKILLERRKELVFRGRRWSDLKRLLGERQEDFPLTRLLGETVIEMEESPEAFVFPIPLEEFTNR